MTSQDRIGPPVRYDGAGVRRERLQELLMLVERNEGVKVEKLTGIMALRTGLTGARIAEYLRELAAGELVAVKDGKVYTRT